MTSLNEYTTNEVDGSEWRFSDLAGRPYVVIFGNMKVADHVTELIASLQGDASTADLEIVQVAHVKGLPKPLQKLASRSLRKAKERQVAERAAHRVRLGLPDDHGTPLRFALDWAGELTDAFGFTHHQTVMVTLLVDMAGTVAGRIEGTSAAHRVRDWYGEFAAHQSRAG